MECEKRNKTKLLLFYSFGTESDVHRCTTVGYTYVKNNPLKYLDAMGTQISNNRSTWERITTGLGNSLSTLWDRRDDIGNDISTAYDGGVHGAQTIAGNIFDSTVDFGNDLSNGDYNKNIANSLRFAGTTFNVAGTALLVTPGGQGVGGFTLGLSLSANVIAEKLDPQPEALIRNSTLDVMTSSMPGGFVKTVGVEVYKATLDNYADKHK